MRVIGDLQLDPLQVVARAQDIALHARVMDAEVDDWARLTYERRQFFEWGGWLAVRPIEELPHYRVLMRRERDTGRMRRIAEAHPEAIGEMRQLLREGREVANRDFAMGDRTRVHSYRGRKDSALALHYLWRVGEAMVIRRERFERVYAAAERVAPARYLRESPDVGRRGSPAAPDRRPIGALAARPAELRAAPRRLPQRDVGLAPAGDRRGRARRGPRSRASGRRWSPWRPTRRR